MTYQEKYEELFKTYDNATKALNEATQKIAFTNGFGSTSNLGNYMKSHREYCHAEREFQELLKYVTTKNLNPASQFLLEDYIYQFIKQDQRKKGITWKDEQLPPSTHNLESLIGLTNDGEINFLIQGTEYKFPVINLHQGKECYNYLTKMLQNDGGNEFESNKLKLTNIDETKQIFLKVVITVWQ